MHFIQCEFTAPYAVGKVNILGGHSIGHSKKKVCMYMCPIPNKSVLLMLYLDYVRL
jgi:hypothetical protein